MLSIITSRVSTIKKNERICYVQFITVTCCIGVYLHTQDENNDTFCYIKHGMKCDRTDPVYAAHDPLYKPGDMTNNKVIYLKYPSESTDEWCDSMILYNDGKLVYLYEKHANMLVCLFKHPDVSIYDNIPVILDPNGEAYY